MVVFTHTQSWARCALIVSLTSTEKDPDLLDRPLPPPLQLRAAFLNSFPPQDSFQSSSPEHLCGMYIKRALFLKVQIFSP